MLKLLFLLKLNAAQQFKLKNAQHLGVQTRAVKAAAIDQE